jgi:hypothetical protein
LIDRDNDELPIERELLPLIAMWMSPGSVIGTGDMLTVPMWIGELGLVPTNINSGLVIIDLNHQLHFFIRIFTPSPYSEC